MIPLWKGQGVGRLGRKAERVEDGIRTRWKKAIYPSALPHLRRLAFKHIHPVQLQLHFRNQEISWVAKKDGNWQLSLLRLCPSHWESRQRRAFLLWKCMPFTSGHHCLAEKMIERRTCRSAWSQLPGWIKHGACASFADSVPPWDRDWGDTGWESKWQVGNCWHFVSSGFAINS